MNSRAHRFAALLAVIGVSIIFGMILGGRLNTPRVVLAAPQPATTGAPAAPLRLAPAATGTGFPDFADIVERTLPAVVGVRNTQMREEGSEESFDERFFRWFMGEPDDRERRQFRDRPRQGFGSGFIISPDGYILTNNHVVSASDRIVVSMQDGSRFDARLIGADPAIDLALIKVDTRGRELPTLPLGDSEKLRVGQWVIAIGNPLEFEQTVTVGVVSAKERSVPLENTDISLATFIQTDAAINFGNSGGPLLDAAGNVVGINTAIRRGNLAEGIGFALPIAEARNAMDQLLSTGEVQRGFLGITLLGQGLSKTAADYYGLPDTYGVIVQDVTPGEPADKAGVRKGDIIRKVDGKIVRDNRDLIRKISGRRPGDRVDLEIVRDGKTVSRTALLIDRREGQQTRLAMSEPEAQPQREQTPASSGLGVTVENLTRTMRSRLGVDEDVQGVLVVDVEIDSPLADTSPPIVPNAVIQSINDRPTRDVGEWDGVISQLKPGSPIKVEVLDPRAATTRYVFLRVPASR